MKQLRVSGKKYFFLQLFKHTDEYTAKFLPPGVHSLFESKGVVDNLN